MALFILYFLPSTTPQSAQCGISRIWVHSQYRRKKVATRLLDCVRWEASDCALIFWRTCSRRFLPFFKRGDRESERESKHAWGEQKKGRSGEGAVNEKKRRSRKGLGRKSFFPTVLARSFVPFACFWIWTPVTQAVWIFTDWTQHEHLNPALLGSKLNLSICTEWNTLSFFFQDELHLRLYYSQGTCGVFWSHTRRQATC